MKLREVMKNFWVRPEAVDFVCATPRPSGYTVEIGLRNGQVCACGEIFSTEKDARNHACYVLGVLFASKE